MKNNANLKFLAWLAVFGLMVYLFTSGDLARALGVFLIILLGIGLLLLKDKIFPNSKTKK